MSKKSDLKELSREEEKLKLLWKDVLKYVKRDIAYLWLDEVKQDFGEMRRELKKIKIILEDLHDYSTARIKRCEDEGVEEKFKKELGDIKKLLEHIKQIQPQKGWIALLHSDLQKIFLNIEHEKFNMGQTEYERRLKQLKEWGFHVKEEPELADFLVKHWAGTTKLAEIPGIFIPYLFYEVLPEIKDLIREHPELWPGIVRIAEVELVSDHNTEFLGIDLHNIGESIYIRPKFWPEVVKMSEAAGVGAASLHSGLISLEDLIKEYPEFWPHLVKMAQRAGKDIGPMFSYGFKSVEKYLKDKKTFLLVKRRLLKLGKLCKGAVGSLFISFKNLKYFFDLFGVDLFDELLIPTAESQTAATFLCLEAFGEITPVSKMVKTKEDLEILRYIVQKKSKRAYDILKHVIVIGCLVHAFDKPFSKETEIIKEFLRQTPVNLIQLYSEFKKICLGTAKEKDLLYKNLFKDVKKIKKEIVAGTLTKYNNTVLGLGVLYTVFAPEISVDRDVYHKLLELRKDRQSDIPYVLNRLSGKTVRIKGGTYVLKEKERLDSSSWNNLIEAVNEVNMKGMKVIPEELGINLFKEYKDKTLRKNQKKYLKKIYAFNVSNGDSLHNFNTDHKTLMQYKEFIGDRLKNDLIFTLLSRAQEAFPKQFSKLLGKSKTDYKKLAKTLFGLWNSKAINKQGKIKKILERNGFFVENIEWNKDITPDQIDDWLNSLSQNVIEKNLVQKIFNDLYGEQYEGMRKEMKKFKPRGDLSFPLGKPFKFVLSKRKMHSVAMLNMGVCVATDQRLWDSPDFWQMIIFDKEDNACGGALYRTLSEENNNYLVLSIQPASSILSSTLHDSLYDQIVRFSKLIVRRLKYQSLLIPTSPLINSNRGTIQDIIVSRNYPKFALKKDYDFSYNPYHYTYKNAAKKAKQKKEFYIVL